MHTRARHRWLSAIAILLTTLLAIPSAFADGEEVITVTFDELHLVHFQGDLIVDYHIAEGDWAQLERAEANPYLKLHVSFTDDPDFERSIALDARHGTMLVPAHDHLVDRDEIDVSMDTEAHNVRIQYFRVDRHHGTRHTLELLPETAIIDLFPPADRPDRDRPSLHDRDRPSLHERDRPSLHDRDRPSLRERDRPSLRDRERPPLPTPERRQSD